MSGFQLIVTEKPSVARDIARVLGIEGRGNGFIGRGERRVTWCVGHLAELAEPASYDTQWRSWQLDSLPMLPEQFKIQAREGSRDQWTVVRELLKDSSLGEVVNPCDAGREGELIFREIYRYAETEKPVDRLWLQSMTGDAIKEGILQPNTTTTIFSLV